MRGRVGCNKAAYALSSLISLLIVFSLSHIGEKLSRPELFNTWATQIPPDPQPDEVNAEIEKLAKAYAVPPIIIKAIAWKESSWKQFNWNTANKEDRRFCKANDYVTLRREPASQTYPQGACGYGIMQVTVAPDDLRVNILQSDWKYNLEAGVQHLLKKWNDSVKDIETRHRELKGFTQQFTQHDKDKAILENWFYAIAWYNGEGQRAYNYVECVYQIIKGQVTNTDKCEKPFQTIPHYFIGQTESKVTFPPDIKSSLQGPIQGHPRCPNKCYTLKELAEQGGRIHRWDWDRNVYIDVTSDILQDSRPPSVAQQPLLKAPWEGIYKISQGNRASFSHNECGRRKLDPNNCNWENTYAIDVAMPYGTPVLAPADGVISFVKDSTAGLGGRELAIKVKGPTGVEYEIVFLHLSKITVFSGRVCQGQVVAYSGASSSGSETGVKAHLHFHIWSGVGSRDSHTQPIERLLLRRADEINFREYDAHRGDLDDIKVADWEFESDNHTTNVCGPQSPLPKERTATVLVMDVSGSMGQSWKGGIKLESAKNAAQQTINLIEQEIRARGDEHRIAIVSFSSDAQLLLGLTTDYYQARRTILSLGSQTSTNIGAGLQVALGELVKQRGKGQRFIILLSDGMTNTGMSRDQILSGPVATARQMSICIHTVGFGDPGDIDENFLKSIAAGSGCGQYLYAGSGFDLMNVYIKLRHISLGQKMGEFSSRGKEFILPNMTTTLGTVYIPDPKQELYFTLSWPEGNRLRAQLFDPAGREVTAAYPGADLKYFDQLVHIIVSQPQAGFWKVAVYGERVPLQGTEYYAILSTRPGGLAVVFDLPPICLKIEGINDPFCVAVPGNLPAWAIVAISLTVLAVLIYLKLAKG